MENNGNLIIEKWSELKSLIEDLDVNVTKNAQGTAAAGVRARKGLRDLKSRAAALVKLTIECDKTNRASKKA